MKKILSALIATTAMTTYSYMRSGGKTRNFREPQLLNMLIENIELDIHKPKAAGWILHYKVGLGFTILYHNLRNKTLPPGIASAVLYGAMSGLVGIAIWNTAFKNHPNPPAIDRRAFNQHILLAHIVFGIFSEVGFRVSEKNA